MNTVSTRRHVLYSSIGAITTLFVWWVGVLVIDGALAERLPYDQYETIALLYPAVFSPGLPGWILAHVQPFHYGVFVVLFAWLIALPY